VSTLWFVHLQGFDKRPIGNQFAQSRDELKARPNASWFIKPWTHVLSSSVENETLETLLRRYSATTPGTPSFRPRLVTHLIIGFVENRAPRRILPPLFLSLCSRSFFPPRRNRIAASWFVAQRRLKKEGKREKEREREREREEGGDATSPLLFSCLFFEGCLPSAVFLAERFSSPFILPPPLPPPPLRSARSIEPATWEPGWYFYVSPFTWNTITDCFSETREWGTSLLVRCPVNVVHAWGRVSLPRVGPRIHLPANDAGESVENDHKSLTSGSFCLHAVSVPFFLSSTPWTGRVFRSRLRRRSIRGHHQRHREPYDSIDQLMLSFLSILYYYDNAWLRLIVRLSVSHKKDTINRGNVKSFFSWEVYFSLFKKIIRSMSYQKIINVNTKPEKKRVYL